jgi:hypothetical protein
MPTKLRRLTAPFGRGSGAINREGRTSHRKARTRAARAASGLFLMCPKNMLDPRVEKVSTRHARVRAPQ